MREKGEAETWNRLIHRHEDLAYSVAYRLLGRAEAATEATEEAAMTAYRALPALRGWSFKTWLLREVVAACRRRSGPGPDGPPAVGRRCLGEERPGPDPAMVQAIETGIARLPLEERVVLVLADVHRLSYEEIAQVTGAAPAAVGRRLGSARGRLRDWLQVTPAVLSRA